VLTTIMSSFIFGLLVASTSVTLTSAVTDGSQFGPVWQRLTDCGTVSSPSNDVARADYAALAQKATQVKICTHGSTIDCITSKPNTYPIKVLRDGKFLLSHGEDGSAPCRKDCVANTWDGPVARTSAATSGCGDIQHGSQSNITNQWNFWACGNPTGIHWNANGRICQWQYRQKSQLELFINSGTSAPTSSPSMAPTQWFQADGHKENVTLLMTDVAALKRQVAALNSRIGTFDGPGNVGDILTDLTVKVDNNAGVLASVVPNVTALSTQMNGIKAALVAAVADGPKSSNCVGSGCTPSIESKGKNLFFSAPGGNILLNSPGCNGIDVCSTSSFSSRLKEALAGL